jgi:hypothetical protein
MQHLTPPINALGIVLAVLISVPGTALAGDLEQTNSIRLINDSEPVRLGQSTGYQPKLGYHANTSFALESGTPDAKTSDMVFYGLGFVPVSDQLSFFGKIGTTLGMGVGGIYQLTDRLGIRAEWEKRANDVNQFSFGLQAKF